LPRVMFALFFFHWNCLFLLYHNQYIRSYDIAKMNTKNICIQGAFCYTCTVRKKVAAICPLLNTIAGIDDIFSLSYRKEMKVMYEYESKKIKNYFELKDVCRKASSSFVGSFMLEMIKRRKEWENPETKMAFVESFYNEYFAWDDECTLERTKNRVNCVIRIIESGMVEDALQYVIDSNSKKIKVPEAKENAKVTLELIQSGKLDY